jgi:hypothetical protein
MFNQQAPRDGFRIIIARKLRQKQIGAPLHKAFGLTRGIFGIMVVRRLEAASIEKRKLRT